MKKYFQTNPELKRKRLAAYYTNPYGGKKGKQTHVPHFTKDKERQRCILCCKFCFTPGTLNKGPEVIQRNVFHKNVKLTDAMVAAPFDSGRQEHMADASCNICKVPLCYKKPRFPGQNKTCWEIFHTQDDLWCGECATLCHVRNPRRELDVECTVKEPQMTNTNLNSSKTKKRKKRRPIKYGGRVMPRRKKISKEKGTRKQRKLNE